MANLLLVLVAFSFMILGRVSSTELFKHSSSADLITKRMPLTLNEDETKSYPDEAIEFPTRDMTHFLSEYRTTVFEHNSKTREEEVMNTKKQLLKNIQRNKKYLTDFITVENNLKHNEQKSFRRIVRPEFISDKDINQDKQITQLSNKIQWPLQIAQEIPSFLQVWPKYLEEALQPPPPFPELIQDKNTSPTYTHSSSGEQGKNLKSIQSIFLPVESSSTNFIKESNDEKRHNNVQSSQFQHKIKSTSFSLPGHEKKEYDTNQKMEIQTKISNDGHVSSKLLHDQFSMKNSNNLVSVIQYLKKPKPDTKKINIEAETDTTGNMKSGHEISKTKFKRNSLNLDIGGEHVLQPWNLNKKDVFFPVMPFSELHEGRQHYQNDDLVSSGLHARKNKQFILEQNQKVQENAGPSLYPQSSFEREFQIPFF